jgi:hypothetical protein
MDRLSIFLTVPIGAVLVGGLAILAMSLGYYGWPTLLGALVIGSLAAWPASYLISRRIKRKDPEWPEDRVDETESIVPRPGAREV